MKNAIGSLKNRSDRFFDEPKNRKILYAKAIFCTCSVLRKMRSVLPNTSRQYEKRDRLIEEPIGSVLRLIYVLLFFLSPNSIFGSSHPLGI